MTAYQKQPKSQDCIHPLILPEDGQSGASSLSGVSRGGVGPSCLYSNNSTEKERNATESPSEIKLSPYFKRQAHTLHSNVERLIKGAPSIGHVAFITLTFRENLKDHQEAGKRFNSFNNHFLRPSSDYGKWVNVKERQSRGALHYHMIVETSQDIREGFDFDLYEAWLNSDRTRKRCPTGNDELRRMWAELRDSIQKYGFGWIVSIEPIKSTSEAISRYVGKYVSKHLENRIAEDKGARLINYSQGFLRNSPKFQWKTANSQEWRQKVQFFAAINGCDDLYQLSDKLGSNWAYRYLEDIVKVYDSVIEYWGKYKPLAMKNSAFDGGRINKETGEIETAEQLEYRDRIFKRIESTRQKKENLLMREAKNDISPKLGYKHWQKTQRIKEQAKIDVDLAKIYFEPPETIYKETEEEKWIRRMDAAIKREELERLLSLPREYLKRLGFDLQTKEEETPF